MAGDFEMFGTDKPTKEMIDKVVGINVDNDETQSFEETLETLGITDPEDIINKHEDQIIAELEGIDMGYNDNELSDEAKEYINKLKKEDRLEVVESLPRPFDTIMDFFRKTGEAKTLGFLKNNITFQTIMQGTVFEIIYAWDTFSDEDKEILKKRYFKLVGGL